MTNIKFIILTLLALPFLHGQKVNNEFEIRIKKANSQIKVDGILDEPDWQVADVATDFYMVLPMDTDPSRARTEVRMTYDDKNIYLSAICYTDQTEDYVVESLKRDFSFGRNDNFLVFIDPFDDQTNGFSFGCNAAGAEWDGLMYDGARVALSWENKWDSRVVGYDDKWIFEAVIPFKTIRYKKGIDKWGVNFSRLDLKLNEKSAWAPVPRQFPTAALAYTGTLVWDQPPPDAGTNISLIPYTLGGIQQDHQGDASIDKELDAGLDAKLAVTSSLNLDLTLNPDFSQVEVDTQVTNLSRYELFFPEKRQFFLENSDLFAGLGFEQVRPFFSRRIGLDSPIQFGARMSGKLNKDWRIGIMGVQSGRVEADNVPTQNFAVAAVQRQVFSRSNITALLINRESLRSSRDLGRDRFTEYNRVAGLEYNLASADNIWNGKFLFHKSFSPGGKKDSFVQAANLVYNTKKVAMEWHHEYVGENFTSDAGFIPRKGYYRVAPHIKYRFFPPSEKIVTHGPSLKNDSYFDASFHPTDCSTLVTYEFEFINRSSFSTWVSDDYVELLEPFDPTNSGGAQIPSGTAFDWNAVGMNYKSTASTLLTYEFSSHYGGYFGGDWLNVTGGTGYRAQPFGSVAVDFSYNEITLPEPYADASFWLISPRFEMTFTKNIYLTTFVQYNEQRDNVNINARFQWRYNPASNFYIVYTDNYEPDSWVARSRALIFKLTFWKNI